MKRTKADTVTDTQEFATINNKVYSPKRFKVVEVNSLMKEKQERLKKFHALQRRALQLQERAQLFSNVDENQADLPEEAMDLIAQAHQVSEELTTIHEDIGNFWILEKAYPDAAEAGDLAEIDFEEVDIAVEKIFEVNPSLGKYKKLLLQNPMNPNG